MDLSVYERGQDFVVEHFKQGDFDYLDGVSELEETEFFRYIGAEKFLSELAESYPSPRLKHDVPVSMAVVSNLTMRLHGEHSFSAYPYVVRCGGMLNAFGPKVGRKSLHPESKEVTLACEGFNAKNTYDRQTPCDQDYLRKFARDTDPERLHLWFNRDVMRMFKKHKMFDPEGIFLGDGSYLFVPDNEKYEGSVRMLFDENNHPVGGKTLTAAQRAKCRWRRCYKLVSLIGINRQGDYFLYAAVAVVPGNVHEGPVLYRLVDGFVEAVGRGVIKRLILDRGFLDGDEIGRCKNEHGIDVLIPVKNNMDIYEDVTGLMRGGLVKLHPYQPPEGKPSLQVPPRVVPEKIRRRERKRQQSLQNKILKKKAAAGPPAAEKTIVAREIGVVNDLRSWSSCPLALSVIINQNQFADGHQETWMLLDTRKVADPQHSRNDYNLRTHIEERHRQLKCFLDLTDFKSQAFSLVVNQVVYVALTYSLLQMYLLRTGRTELNRRTLPRIRKQLMPTRSVVIIYYQNRYATLSIGQYTQILLTLSEQARKNILAKTRKLEEQLAHDLLLVRPP